MSILQRLIGEQKMQLASGGPSDHVYISWHDFDMLETELDLDHDRTQPITMMLFIVIASRYINDGSSAWSNGAYGTATPPPPGRKVTYVQPQLPAGSTPIVRDGSLHEFYESTVAKSGCQHEYKRYDGLLESFEYCVKCDEKKTDK